MKTGIKVGDIMTRNFEAVTPDTSVLECARRMIKKRVGSLVVERDKKLVGLVTERDIVWALSKKPKADWAKIKVKDIIPRKTLTIRPSADLNEALKKMRKTGCRWLPVVIKKRVIGFVTIKDILRIEPELVEDMSQLFRIREESEKLKRARGEERWVKEGICEECGNYDILYKVDDRLLCETCKDNV